MTTQYYQIGIDGYPIISPIALDGFTEYTVGQEPLALLSAMPILQEEVDSAAQGALWELVDTFEKNLKVTVNGHIYAANKLARDNIRQERDSLLSKGSGVTEPWIEPWGTFTTDAVELQEVLDLAVDTLRTYRNSVFGV